MPDWRLTDSWHNIFFSYRNPDHKNNKGKRIKLSGFLSKRKENIQGPGIKSQSSHSFYYLLLIVDPTHSSLLFNLSRSTICKKIIKKEWTDKDLDSLSSSSPAIRMNVQGMSEMAGKEEERKSRSLSAVRRTA